VAVYWGNFPLCILLFPCVLRNTAERLKSFVNIWHNIYSLIEKQLTNEMKILIMRMRNQNGLTLLEVLISMVILSISLLLLLNMAMVALDSNDWSNKATIATQLLQQKLEQLRNTTIPVSGADTSNGVELNWTVSDVGSHLRQVDITATWEDIKSSPVTNSITTFIKTDSV